MMPWMVSTIDNSAAQVVTGVGGDSAAWTNFQARASLSAPYDGYYKTLLNGLTTDGLFNSDGSTNYFDALYILATVDASAASLNLVSSSFTATPGGTPTFTTNHGFLANANGDFLNLNLNPGDGGGPYKFIQNSAHWSVWNNNNATKDVPIFNGNFGYNFYIKLSDGSIYTRVNDASERAGIALSNPTGLLIGTREATAAGSTYHYVSGSGGSIGTTTNTSQAVLNQGLLVLGIISLADTAHQLAAVSVGASLSSTDTSNLYSRLQAYMTSVGN